MDLKEHFDTIDAILKSRNGRFPLPEETLRTRTDEYKKIFEEKVMKESEKWGVEDDYKFNQYNYFINGDLLDVSIKEALNITIIGDVYNSVIKCDNINRISPISADSYLLKYLSHEAQKNWTHINEYLTNNSESIDCSRLMMLLGVFRSIDRKSVV